MVDPEGLEPTTGGLWDRCSNQLRYRSKMVAAGGLEPSTCRVWTERSNQLGYAAMFSTHLTRLNIIPNLQIKSSVFNNLLNIFIFHYLIFTL